MIAPAIRRVLPLSVLLLAVLASGASAQFGGLKKKAARAAGIGTGESNASAQGRVNVTVTPEVIDHYLAGLKARKEERDRIAKTNTPVGQYYAAVDEYKAHQKHCDDFNRKRSENYSRLIAQQKYDSAGQAMTARDASCEAGAPQPQEPDFQQLSAAQGREDTAAAAGANMDVASWASLDEWVPQLMSRMVDSPEQSSAQLASNFGRKQSEVDALKARKDEIAAALGIPPKQKPVEQPAPPPQMAAPAAGAASPSIPASGAQCMQAEMTNQKAALEAMGKRAQAAKDAGDMAKTMAISDSVNQVNMAIMKKCGMMK